MVLRTNLGETADQVTSVVIAFHPQWLAPITRGTLKTFIRKKPPKNIPETVYFYIKAPISGIVAKANITNVREIDRDEALDLQQALQMSSDDIFSYVGHSKVGLFELRNLQTAAHQVSREQMIDMLRLHPPQGIQRLTASQICTIEEFGSFS